MCMCMYTYTYIVYMYICRHKQFEYEKLYVYIYIDTECDLPITIWFEEILEYVIKVYPHRCLQSYILHVYVFCISTICEIMTLVLTIGFPIDITTLVFTYLIIGVFI